MKYTQSMLCPGALEDKIIVVTGGGSGLGKSMSKYFLELGAKVVITSRNIEKLQKAADELTEQTGGEVLPLAWRRARLFTGRAGTGEECKTFRKSKRIA